MARPARPEVRIVDAALRALASDATQLPAPTHIEVAFAGRSNVGKSSLMNALCSRKKLVYTSSTPGSTRKIGFFDVRAADGAVLTLVDLPGYGYAKRSKSERASWGELVERYLLERTNLAAVVLIFDARRGLEPEDRDLMKLIADAGHPITIVLVATKLDKLSASERKPRLFALRREIGRPLVGFEAPSGNGREELWLAIRSALGLGPQGTLPTASEPSSKRPQSP